MSDAEKDILTEKYCDKKTEPATVPGKMAFNIRDYMRDSYEQDFCMGKRALDNENFDEARTLLEKAYKQGNVLAGVLLGTMYYSGKGCERDYDKAIPFFIDGMYHGNPLGTEWLALAYRFGRSVPKDRDKATKLFWSCEEALELMCASGSTDAQYAYGFDLLYGYFQSEDDKKALYWLTKAMDGGHIAAGVEVARIYLNGWGVEKDTDKGLQILFKYSSSKSKEVHFELGKAYYCGETIEQDYQKALYHFLKAAEQGHAKAQSFVGKIYFYFLGEGVPVDYAEAKKWYELSDRQGNALAAMMLGLIYYDGKGVSVDSDKAFQYFKKSADKGNDTAQYLLADLYYFRKVKYQNYELGRQYLEKSAEQGNVNAQKLLARCYIGSFNFAEEDDKFVYWMRKAAEQDDAEAQRILGEAYIKLENEDALPTNYSDAVKWFEKAAAKNDIQANMLLAEVYATVEEYKNHLKTSYYLTQAEKLLEEKKGTLTGAEHKQLADLYYNISYDGNSSYKGDIDICQRAAKHYCIAFMAGWQDALCDLAWMYFVEDFDGIIKHLSMTQEELLQKVIDTEKNSDSPDLAFLLGIIYFNGYRVRQNKFEAEKWWLTAIEKGSLKASCKLALYYINDKKQYDKGFSVLEKAYKAGSVEATRLLGLCYKKSIGVKKNRSKAKALLKEASDKGDLSAVAELKKFLF